MSEIVRSTLLWKDGPQYDCFKYLHIVVVEYSLSLLTFIVKFSCLELLKVSLLFIVFGNKLNTSVLVQSIAAAYRCIHNFWVGTGLAHAVFCWGIWMALFIHVHLCMLLCDYEWSFIIDILPFSLSLSPPLLSLSLSLSIFVQRRNEFHILFSLRLCGTQFLNICPWKPAVERGGGGQSNAFPPHPPPISQLIPQGADPPPFLYT